MNKKIEDDVFQEQYLSMGKNVFNDVKKSFEHSIGDLLTNAAVKNHITFKLPIAKEHKNRNICLVKLNGHLAEPYVIVEDFIWPFKHTIYHLPPVTIRTFSDAARLSSERDADLFNLDIALHRAQDAEWCEANCDKTLTDDFKKTLNITTVPVINVQDFELTYHAGMWFKINITYKDINPTTPDVE